MKQFALLVLALLVLTSHDGYAGSAAQEPPKPLIQTLPVGGSSSGLAFDGENIWVVLPIEGSVQKLRGSDGVLLDTFYLDVGLTVATFDGENIWVANGSNNIGSVTKMRATDGA